MLMYDLMKVTASFKSSLSFPEVGIVFIGFHFNLINTKSCVKMFLIDIASIYKPDLAA